MKFFGYSIMLIFIISSLYACNNPLEDVSIKIKDPLTSSAINLTYKNAVANDTTLVPKQIKFTFLGEDAEGIVSSVGNKKINISREGLLGIAIAPDYVKRPANIKVVASLEGYLTDINYITLTNTANINKTIRMFNISNLPKGMSVDVKKIESTNVESTTTTLKTNGKNEQVSIVLNAGTNLLAPNTEKLSGQFSYILTHFENIARDFVPSNYTIYQAVGVDNKEIPPFELVPYGFFSLKAMNDKFDEGSNLSKSTSVSIEISNNSYHTNGQILKEGDAIPFWGYINNVWKMLGNPIIKKNSNGKLYVSSNITALTYYALGEMIPVCVKGPIIKVTSQNNGLDIYHYCRLVEVSSGRNVGDLYISLNNGALYSLAGRRKNTVYLQVYNFNNQFGGDLSKPIFQSQPFDLCDEKTIPVNIVAPPPQPVNVELIIECPKGQVVNEPAVPVKIDIQFQPKGAAASDWRDLMTLTRTQRSGSTYKLKVGSTYSIRASPNPAQGWIFYKRDTLIKDVNYRFYIDSKDFCK
ncbi:MULTISPECIES: hypothetical protein [unclassified Arcicella]|nr:MULTISPECIES: hypothetical protein [unclassified Arcicella]MDR6825961.1 hypothetical protein [Arcicella sp. BE139]